MTTQIHKPQYGDIWEVEFDPTRGDEIQKKRPAVVMSVSTAGKMRLRIVVPITEWKSQFISYFWMVKLLPDNDNHLMKESAADAVQVKSVALERFKRFIGRLDEQTTKEIATAIALCVGYDSDL